MASESTASSPLKPLSTEAIASLLLSAGLDPQKSSRKRKRDSNSQQRGKGESHSDSQTLRGLSPDADVEEGSPCSLDNTQANAWTCQHCSKIFKRRSDLDRHERAKPFTCEFCWDLSYVRKSTLVKHYARSHPGEVLPSPPSPSLPTTQKLSASFPHPSPMSETLVSPLGFDSPCISLSSSTSADPEESTEDGGENNPSAIPVPDAIFPETTVSFGLGIGWGKDLGMKW
ncbi:MAG: hypothetical protein CYPHOPRED_005947 [Cyphobasidiales sp. Tagirdzhanova-0007]|nr:MAG: hypothetical protein CYPHOPRED_005947 [Cyphobasidiales sp. Tagirdzhanova-0007]